MLSVNSFAQNCDDEYFYDSGGKFGNYLSTVDTTWTVCSDDPASEVIELYFYSWDVHCSDTLFVYDGPTIAATQIGTFCGSGASNAPGKVETSNVSGCLTFRFISDDDNFVGTGWEAGIYCREIPPITTLNYPVQDEVVTFTGNHIIADNSISGTSDIDLTACEVSLKPGFEVQAGATFQASIANCLPSDPLQETPNVAVDARQFLINTTVPNQLTIFPNPFSISTTIQFELEQSSAIQLQLLDFTGKILSNLLPKSHYESGTHQVILENSALQPAIYFLKLTSQEGPLVKKVMLVK